MALDSHLRDLKNMYDANPVLGIQHMLEAYQPDIGSKIAFFIDTVYRVTINNCGFLLTMQRKKSNRIQDEIDKMVEMKKIHVQYAPHLHRELMTITYFEDGLCHVCRKSIVDLRLAHKRKYIDGKIFPICLRCLRPDYALVSDEKTQKWIKQQTKQMNRTRSSRGTR